MSARKEIEKRGYKISRIMNSGRYIAKGRQTFSADTLTELLQKIKNSY